VTKIDYNNKKLILGVTGSIAAYKALELTRLLKKDGYDVWVVMTSNAKKFVTPLSFETLSHNPVFSEMFYKKEIMPVHIDLSKDASAVLVAPATANIIAKAAAGIADDLLSTIILSANKPVIFIPAMNHRMWEAAVTQRNVNYLKSLGFKFVEPETGELACHEIGKGRFPPVAAICEELEAVLSLKQFLKDKKVVITAGRTEEAIDPIRVITNRSSGRMGFALAKAAQNAGANVKLIGGNLSIPAPSGIDTFNVHSSQDMLSVINEELDDADVLIMAAAVSDYRPATSLNKKQKEKEITLRLTRTQDILKTIAQKKHKAYLVGFSLDTHDNLNEAKRKLKEKKLNLIVANPIETLNSDRIKPTIIYNKPKEIKTEKLPTQTKKAFAEKLIEIISKEIKK
jgi:phosphopantothenoylcysteine decarboxylase/phosphopantothenate--cysteine ligase